MAAILVVDDEPDIRMLVRFTLELDGHDVREAEDGRAALEAVESSVPDLVVLDVMMPGVSGWDTLTELKKSADERIRTVPVIMLTALSEPMDRARGGIEGAVRYLAKPIAPDDLRVTVTDALSGDPEPVQRRRAQQQALEDLARIERGSAPPVPEGRGPRPRLSALESARSAPRQPPGPTLPDDLPERVAALTTKQRELLGALADAPTVIEAAANLEMSRSNVYASLRRIARRLGVAGVSELLELVRTGHVPTEG